VVERRSFAQGRWDLPGRSSHVAQLWTLASFASHVHVQPLFATWAANWDLFGAPVWFFLAAGFIGAFFASRLSPLAVTARQRLLPWLPTFMLVGCLFTRWVRSRSAWFLDWYFYKFYYAHLDIAFIVCFAFGVAFTLDLLRTPDRGCRIVGWLFVPVYLSLLAGALWYIQGWYESWKDAG